MTDAATQTEKPNRMERRRLETRGKLLTATLKLVLKKGIEKTTMDGITEAADLGRRTLYYHFSSKEECILAAVAGEYEKHAELAEIALPGSDDPALAVATHSHSVLAGILAEPITARLVEYPKLLAGALEQAIGRFALQDIRAGVEQGRFQLLMSERVLDRLLVWSLVGLLIEGIEGEGEIKALQSAYAVMVLSILGIPSDESRLLSEQAAR